MTTNQSNHSLLLRVAVKRSNTSSEYLPIRLSSKKEKEKDHLFKLELHHGDNVKGNETDSPNSAAAGAMDEVAAGSAAGGLVVVLLIALGIYLNHRRCVRVHIANTILQE